MDAPPFCENKSLYRVICLEHIKKEQAIREAVFSAQMEGLRVTAETERRIRKILDGELTVRSASNSSSPTPANGPAEADFF